MWKVAIFLILVFGHSTSMAAQRCYDTTPSEDRAIQWMANRDSSTTAVAFARMVESAMSQLKAQAKRAAENPLQNAYRSCLDNNKTFTITTNSNTGLPVGVCQ